MLLLSSIKGDCRDLAPVSSWPPFWTLTWLHGAHSWGIRTGGHCPTRPCWPGLRTGRHYCSHQTSFQIGCLRTSVSLPQVCTLGLMSSFGTLHRAVYIKVQEQFIGQEVRCSESCSPRQTAVVFAPNCPVVSGPGLLWPCPRAVGNQAASAWGECEPSVRMVRSGSVKTGDGNLFAVSGAGTHVHAWVLFWLQHCAHGGTCPWHSTGMH